MTTGEKIKQLRKQLGMTQEELGNLIGVQKAAINKYETGVVSNLKQETIASLAHALHVSPIELLSPEDQPSDPVPANDNVRLLINGANKMDPEDVKDITDWIRFWYTKKYPNLFDEKGTEDNADT